MAFLIYHLLNPFLRPRRVFATADPHTEAVLRARAARERLEIEMLEAVYALPARQPTGSAG